MKKIIFFLILFFCFNEQNASIVSRSFDDVYSELTADNEEPVDIYELHTKTNRLNGYFYGHYEQDNKFKVRMQTRWDNLSKTMMKYSSMDIEMFRLAERIVFASYAIRNLDFQDVLVKFCGIFTYCVYDKIIKKTDYNLINAIKNCICLFEIKEDEEGLKFESAFPQIPYIAVIACQLEDNIERLPKENENQKNALLSLQATLFDLFFESSIHNKPIKTKCIENIDEVIRELDTNEGRIDLQEREECVKKLPIFLQREKPSAKNLDEFCLGFKNRFSKKMSKVTNKQRQERMGKDEERQKQENNRRLLKKIFGGVIFIALAALIYKYGFKKK